MSRERYSTPFTCARTCGRLPGNAAATSLGTTTAWPPPCPAERISAVNAIVSALGVFAGINQLPGTWQQPSCQQDLDDIANKEWHHPKRYRLAERHVRDQHQAGDAKDIDDEVSESHHANGRQHSAISAALSEPADQPGRHDKANDVAERCQIPAALMTRKPWHTSDSHQQVEGHRGAPSEAAQRSTDEQYREGLQRQRNRRERQRDRYLSGEPDEYGTADHQGDAADQAAGNYVA